MNIRVYLLNLYLVSEYPNIFGRYKDTGMNTQIYLTSMFPLNHKKHEMKIRKPRKYKTYKQNTKRLKKSALPYMRKLLNDKNEKNQIILKNIQTMKV